jgi:arylsulfatase A-like enzyme
MKKITRREFGKQIAVLGAVAMSASALRADADITANKNTKPNIIVILTDDSGYSDLGCYGGEIDTPNIDRLGYKGMRFKNFYTAARCSPTRASLLTGRDSAHAGFGAGTLGGWNREMKLPAYRARLPYELPIIPELLKSGGYETMMVGKWHLGGSLMKGAPAKQALWKRQHPGWELTDKEIEADFNALPAQRGFDKFFGLVEGETHFFFTPSDHHEYLNGNDDAELNYDRTYDMHCYYDREDRYPYTENHNTGSKAFYATDGTTDKAIEMINDNHRQNRKPFFLYLAYRSPHLPLQAPQQLVDKYMPRYKDLAKVESSRFSRLVEEGLLPAGTDYRSNFQNRKMTPDKEADFQRRLAIHAAMLEKVDENVKRVVDTLEKNEQLENTLILYLSDNGAAAHVGEMMNKPYRGCKALIWEGGTRTHLIAYWKDKIKPATINNTFCDVRDIMPTCLALAGVDYPEVFRDKKTAPLDGRDISAAFKNKELPPVEYIFLNDKGQQGCIYKGKWKLLIQPGWYVLTSKEPGISYELYDLENDPAETKNLSKQMPVIVEKLEAECEKWQKKCGLVDYGEILKIRPDHTK